MIEATEQGSTVLGGASDRQLLEDAARAAGLHNRLFFSPSPVVCPQWKDRLGTWDPLINDADALRLAVNLRLSLDLWTTRTAGAQGRVLFDGGNSLIFINAGEQSAATRRAIVCAAAAIGAQS